MNAQAVFDALVLVYLLVLTLAILFHMSDSTHHNH